MIKLKNILLENRGHGISRKAAMKIIKETDFIYESIKNDKWNIYRGFPDADDFYLVDPKQHDRVSRNTNNYYTLIIDNSDRWKNYPDRSKSLICSLDEEIAERYGDLYVILPLERDARVAFCPMDDIWISFSGIHLQELNMYITSILTIMFKNFPNFFDVDDISKYTDYDSYYTYTDLIMLFNNLDSIKEYAYEKLEEVSDMDPEELEQMQDNGEDESYLYDYIESEVATDIDMYYRDVLGDIVEPVYGSVETFFSNWFNSENKSFLDYVEDFLDPNDNEFSVHKYYSDSISNDVKHSDYEVWTDSKCLAILYEEFEEILNELNIEK